MTSPETPRCSLYSEAGGGSPCRDVVQDRAHDRTFVEGGINTVEEGGDDILGGGILLILGTIYWILEKA